jgi:hypothetical protein
MSASASAIVDGCVTVIEGITAVGSGNVSKRGYDIVERTTSEVCFRVRPSRGEQNLTHMSTTSDTGLENVYIKAEGFVRLQDNYDTYYDTQTTLIESMKSAFNGAQTLGGTVEWAVLSTWDIPDMELDVGGTLWQPMDFMIRVFNI